MSYWNDFDIEVCDIVEGDAEIIYQDNLALKTLSLEQEINVFLNVLFNEDDHICICRSPFDYFFVKKSEYKGELGKLVAINPSDPSTSTRRTSDITQFRIFLIEFDDITLSEQYHGLRTLEFPYATITFSGNRSLHIVLSLEHELSDKSEYYFYANWIHNIFKENIGKPDNSTKAPSFLTRFPNVLGDDGFVSQKLLAIGNRISIDLLHQWLAKYPNCKPENKPSSFEEQDLRPEREGIISLVDWYVFDHLKDSYTKSGKWFQCPLCKEEGKAHYGKKLCINGVNRYISCVLDPEHNKTILKKIWQLKNGGNNNG
jgi:hypothetical protein